MIWLLPSVDDVSSCILGPRCQPLVCQARPRPLLKNTTDRTTEAGTVDLHPDSPIFGGHHVFGHWFLVCWWLCWRLSSWRHGHCHYVPHAVHGVLAGDLLGLGAQAVVRGDLVPAPETDNRHNDTSQSHAYIKPQWRNPQTFPFTINSSTRVRGETILKMFTRYRS